MHSTEREYRILRSGCLQLRIAGVVSAFAVGSAAIAGPTSDQVQGYTGSEARGYTGSEARGYTGSEARGYTGSEALGYTGSEVRGYTGSEVRGYRARVDCKVFGDGFAVAAMGPVESIAQKGDVATLVILGQAFEIPAAASNGFALGDFAVAGTDSANGATAYHVGSVYVAGISGVRLKAPVTAVDSSVGTASLGAATVNYTALLSADPAAVPAVGASLVVTGTQPVAKGAVLAGPGTGATVGCSAL